MTKRISIIIPAYNEEKRIKHTLQAYFDFFLQKQHDQKLSFEIIIVLNGCKDNTLRVVENFQKNHVNCFIMNLKEAGKGLAIKAGFQDALSRSADLIGYVDADMATRPEDFYALIQQMEDKTLDGVIASRYMPDSKIYPPRPRIKRWGSFLIYESLISLLFGLRNKDYQCGAKLFKAEVIKKIVPSMTITHWAFDVEILYLCKKFGFKIKEVPTTWHDQAGSKLRIHSGIRMLGSLFNLRFRHLPLIQLKQ
jgi:glycosyltransferase involved in cell wall biosynthesis